MAAPVLAVTRPASGPLRVMFAGDSLTYGLYASSATTGYRQLMLAQLRKGGPVTELGVGLTGANVGKVAGVLSAPAGVDLAVIELGTNDVGKTPLATLSAEYGALLAKVRSQSPRVAILCVGIWNVDPGIDAAITAQCHAHGGVFVSLVDLFENPDNRGPAGVHRYGGVSDDFHPNDAGYAAIASRLLGSLRVG